MTLVTAPAFAITSIDWYLDRPAQVNRGAYSGSRQVVANPWHGKWRASVTLRTEQGEANFLANRAFLISLKGQVNTFLLPATESAQHGLGAGTISASAAQGANSVTLANTNTNLISNGFFSTTSLTGWTAQDGTVSGSVVSGQLQVTSNGSGHFSYAVTVAPGQAYQFTGTLVSGSGSPRVGIGTSPSNSTYMNASAVGTLAAVFVPTVSTVYVTIADVSGTSGMTTVVDNLYLRIAPGLKAGMLATFSLPSGNYQMVALTADMAQDGSITFEPALREALSSGAAIDHDTPDCHVALSNSEFGWNIGQWRRYGVSFDVEEAF